MNFALGRDKGPLSQQFLQAELSSLELRASTLSETQLSDQNIELWGTIVKDRKDRISRVGTMQPTADEWLKQAAATKTQLQYFISQASSTPLQQQRQQCQETVNMQSLGLINNTEYWVKDDQRIQQWFSYPGVSVMLQRTQSVMDLLVEIDNQAVQKR
jgi:hypothetical protein